MIAKRFRFLVHAPVYSEPQTPRSPILRLAAALRMIPSDVVVVQEALVDQAVSHIHDEQRRTPLDAIIAADLEVLVRLAEAAPMRGRLWPLMTEVPPLALVTGASTKDLERISGAARFVICPDELTRSVVDAASSAAARRTVVVPLDDPAAHPDARLTEALRMLMQRAQPAEPALTTTGRPLRIVVAGHALHFMDPLLEYFGSLPEIDLRVDRIPSFARHDERVSMDNLCWADVVICEWCSPVAIWYSRNKRPGQRLIVRLHRYELDTSWPAQLQIGAVDQVICVGPHYARLTLERTGWPAEKVTVLPNFVDVDRFDRPKVPGAEFHLGFLGMVPRRKRLDLALDLLEILRRRDERFTLFVKTKMPWDDAWNRTNDAEQAYAQAIFRRIQRSELLREGLVFDRYGVDVAAWMRKIGFVVSTSDDESFHLAPAEAMSSGSVPVIRNWPGAVEIYEPRWVYADVAEMAHGIDGIVSSGAFLQLRKLAQSQARASFDVGVVRERFVELLRHNLPAANSTGIASEPLSRRAVTRSSH